MRAKSPATHRLPLRLLRDERGASAIEFALVGPMVFILILGTVEVALDMIVDASVQFAAQQASRAGLTTANPTSGTRDAAARQTIDNILGGWVRMGGTVTIQTRAYSTYNDIATNNYQSTMGGFGDVVTYNVSLTMPSFSGIPKLFGIDTLTFQRNYLVQNEK
jgi:Flp pilus assembly protein TadG